LHGAIFLIFPSDYDYFFRSHDGLTLGITSSDGYCSFVIVGGVFSVIVVALGVSVMVVVGGVVLVVVLVVVVVVVVLVCFLLSCVSL